MTGVDNERWQAEVDARLARLELRADEADLADIGLHPRPDTATPVEEDYPDLKSWVQNYFCATFARPLGGEFRWCSEWQQHREAVVRLEALWSSWKSLRRDKGLGLSSWFHNYLDPQLSVLLGARGPFSQCSPDRHEASSSRTQT